MNYDRDKIDMEFHPIIQKSFIPGSTYFFLFLIVDMEYRYCVYMFEYINNIPAGVNAKEIC